MLFFSFEASQPEPQQITVVLAKKKKKKKKKKKHHSFSQLFGFVATVFSNTNTNVYLQLTRSAIRFDTRCFTTSSETAERFFSMYGKSFGQTFTNLVLFVKTVQEQPR
jgi:hypothetical protein